MFDISENGKETVVSYLKETCGKNKARKPGKQKNTNELDDVAKKSNLQSLILAKSLIVKL